VRVVRARALPQWSADVAAKQLTWRAQSLLPSSRAEMEKKQFIRAIVDAIRRCRVGDTNVDRTAVSVRIISVVLSADVSSTQLILVVASK